MIEIRKGIFTYFIACGQFPNGDSMYAAQRIDGEIKINFRFRYHVDEFAHNSLDKKSWYEMDVPDGDVSKALEILQMTNTKLTGEKLDVLWLNTEELSDEQMEQIESKEWMHTRKATKSKKDS